MMLNSALTHSGEILLNGESTHHFLAVLNIEPLCRYLRQTTTLQIISRSIAASAFNTFNTGQTTIQFQAED